MDGFIKTMYTLVFGLGYAVFTPMLAIFTTGCALFCGEEDATEYVSALKLCEIVCEALPQVIIININNNNIIIISIIFQVCLSYAYLAIIGMPWEKEDPDIWTWLPLLSNLSSTMMCVIGVVSGISVCKNGGFDIF